MDTAAALMTVFSGKKCACGGARPRGCQSGACRIALHDCPCTPRPLPPAAAPAAGLHAGSNLYQSLVELPAVRELPLPARLHYHMSKRERCGQQAASQTWHSVAETALLPPDQGAQCPAGPTRGARAARHAPKPRTIAIYAASAAPVWSQEQRLPGAACVAGARQPAAVGAVAEPV